MGKCERPIRQYAKVATDISQNERPDTFDKSKRVAKRGGGVAGTARKATEKELGRSVISQKNYLGIRPKKELEE